MRPELAKTFAYAALVGVLSGAANASAEAARFAYRDGDGRWQWMSPEATERSGLKSVPGSELWAGVFTVTYLDVEESTGAGFDDPELGEARRMTMHAVLEYLSSILDVTGTADLLVMESQTDGAGPLAAAGPFLIAQSGFQGGLVYEHLIFGVDPAPDVADGTVSVDFGHSWNSHLDAPARDEHDLYTTLLHEVTHALGFFSTAASDGRSAVFNSDESGLFSILDSLLLRGSTETRLFLADGAFNAAADDLVSGDVVFTGERAGAELGTFPRVFAPSPFREGSSIGHWSTSNGFDSVMLPALQPGVERRRYTAWELQALADLGYGLAEDRVAMDGGAPDAADPPPIAPDPDPTSPPSGNPPPRAEPDPGSDLPTPAASVAPSSGCSVHRDDDSPHGSVLLGLALLALMSAIRRRGSSLSRGRCP